MTDKICANCIYHELSITNDNICIKNKKIKVDIINGEVTEMGTLCKHERDNLLFYLIYELKLRIPCGKRGRYFEPKLKVKDQEEVANHDQPKLTSNKLQSSYNHTKKIK